MITQRMLVNGGNNAATSVSTWTYTIDTSLSDDGLSGSVPFNMYGDDSDITLTVDWGDGETSTLTSANYSSVSDSDASVHTYAEAGTYTITIASEQWDSVYIDTLQSSSITSGYAPHIATFRKTLASLDGALPAVAGVYSRSSSTVNTRTLNANNFNYLFGYCTGLVSISGDLFSNCTDITSCIYMFVGCTSLVAIPAGLFDNNAAITTCNGIFKNCTSLTTIPENLFAQLTSATTFSYMFYGCTSLVELPESLFPASTVSTLLSYAFYGCTSLESVPENIFANVTTCTSFTYTFKSCTGLTTIPENLFANNTAVTNYSYTFYGCTNLGDFSLRIGSSSVSTCTSFVTKNEDCTRIVYVPSGSTTATKFNALSLGLTIVEE